MRLEYEEYSKFMHENEIEKKAAELEVTCDYYIQEFMWILTPKNWSIWIMFYVVPVLILLLRVANLLPPASTITN